MSPVQSPVRCPHCKQVMDSFSLDPVAMTVKCYICQTSLNLLTAFSEGEQVQLGHPFPEHFQSLYYFRLGYTQPRMQWSWKEQGIRLLTLVLLLLPPLGLMFIYPQASFISWAALVAFYIMIITLYWVWQPRTPWIRTDAPLQKPIPDGEWEWGV